MNRMTDEQRVIEFLKDNVGYGYRATELSEQLGIDLMEVKHILEQLVDKKVVWRKITRGERGTEVYYNYVGE